ncbi:MAG: ribbon-helix-helix domain-containing protein [Candidatus Uhrbacteria bacterium]|nr:ribbon-helix-helix domain-containing protein [Candidatus Uhrbacteria bacterium]
MRTSTLVTVSLPSGLRSASEKVAKRKHMTRSELVRTALRSYIASHQTEEALRVYREEKQAGKLKVLKGSLADLMSA